jgi:Coenzyme PQQ synthesis protein D (PqqD)
MIIPHRLRPHGAVVHDDFGDETVIVNLETGSYYSTKSAGSMIWSMVTGGAARTEIVRRLCAEHSGNPEEIVIATSSFIDELIGECLAVENVEPSSVESISQVSPKSSRREEFVAPRLQKYSDMEELLKLDPVHEVDEFGWPSAKELVV